jgi:transcriptional regulator with XRE-family HTH domain
LQSFRTKIDARRQTFLVLVGEVERQLRDAYDRKFRAQEATQSSLADKLGINRSAVNRRLTGRTNMTIETLADMVWALDQSISVKISDPTELQSLNTIFKPQFAPLAPKATAATPIQNQRPEVLERLIGSTRPNASPAPTA